jgi:hypothetical protein
VKMEDLKVKVNYNFAGDYIVFLGSLSNFQEEGTMNCAVSRTMFLSDPASIIQNSFNSIIEKLIEQYIKPDHPPEVIEAQVIEAQIVDSGMSEGVVEISDAA